ncbi:hypothetical protein [Oceanobacillus saliphilus]|uniref:hypothetical protein n=1 Tax=Oceanobacillus saliphilus TaxID=2925834 RepID=UPI00201E51E9|nr:hypothetical protein [Oceanobacillus saliphilus]
MEKIIEGRLVGFGTLKDLEEYEDYIYLGGAITEERYNAYKNTPSKEECDRLCEEQSGEVIIYKLSK